MPRERGQVWTGAIDHTRWSVLVDGSGVVVQIFRPHAEGTLKVYARAGQRVVALVSEPSPGMVDMCKVGAAYVDANGALRETAQASVVWAEAECVDIDARTRAALAEGVEWNALRHSLSPNAMAKLEALHALQSCPVALSTIDNRGTITLSNADELDAFVAAARARLISVIAEGDRQKAAARSRARGG